MFYDVRENELIPLEKYWALVPKIQMLDPNKVKKIENKFFLFDKECDIICSDSMHFL